MKRMMLLAALPLAFACTPPEENADAGPDPLNEEACEHMADGPFVDLDASADGTNLADMSDDHTAYRIATADIGDGNRGGSVSFESSEETNHTFWLDSHFDLKFIGSDDSEAMIVKSVHAVDECEEVMMFHTVMLGVGTYTVEIGPTQSETVTLVWEHGEPAGEDGGMDHPMDM
jgi:hypothetical protein